MGLRPGGRAPKDEKEGRQASVRDGKKEEMKIMTLKKMLVAGTIALAVIPAAVAAQAPSRISTYEGALNADGTPNLDGTWTNVTLTRFERDPKFGDRKVLTPEEVSALEGEVARVTALANSPTDVNATVETLPADCSGGRGDNCNYNAAWTEPGSHIMLVNGEPRSSIVTVPANGRIPYRPEVRARMTRSETSTDNPEDRSLPERCLVSQNIRFGSVMNSTLYNNTYRIAQSKDSVAIVVEMSHDVRLVRLNSKHPPQAIRPWLGDSIGWYDGDTLVVETTNFHPQQTASLSDDLKVTERFTRIAKDRILYRFTVEAPATFTQPWGGEYEFSPANGPLYEYACHEGNRGLENILAGARQEDAALKASGAQSASR
jgi:hypothetical protein